MYRSIMIALGRDLSDEIMEYIISNNREKGILLSEFSDAEIKALIKTNAKLRTIKTINMIIE